MARTNADLFVDGLTGIADAIREKTNTTDAVAFLEMPNLIRSINTGEAGVAEVICAVTGLTGYDSLPAIFSNPAATATVVASSTAVSILDALDQKYLVSAICAAAGVTGSFSTYETLFNNEAAVEKIVASDPAMSIIGAFQSAKDAADASEVMRAARFGTVEGVIQMLDSKWDTDDAWNIMAQCAPFSADYANMFTKYIGRKKTISHSTYGSHEVRVVGIAHDSRVSGGKAMFTFEHVDIPFTRQWNTSRSNSGGVPKMPLHTYLQNDYFNGLPEAVKRAIVSVQKPCSLSQNATPTNVECKIFIPSEMEIFGTHSYDNEGTQYKYWADNNNNNARIKKYNGSAYFWWLRSPYGSNSFGFVSAGGTLYTTNADGTNGVSPSFCIG